MKKFLPLIIVLLFLFVLPFTAYAQNVTDIFEPVKPPPQISTTDPGEGISILIQRVIQIMYVIGTIGFMFMLLWSGLQMILNAGDKEAAGNARKRITTAIIGITLLALAFPIMKVLEAIIGIKFFF